MNKLFSLDKALKPLFIYCTPGINKKYMYVTWDFVGSELEPIYLVKS